MNLIFVVCLLGNLCSLTTFANAASMKSIFDKRGVDDKENVFEVMVFVDNKLNDYVPSILPDRATTDPTSREALVNTMVRALLNNVQAIYRNKNTLGKNIRVEILQIVMLKGGEFDEADGDADGMLANFCQYVNTLKFNGVSHPNQYDVAVYLTRTDIISGGNPKPTGRATTSGACNKTLSCAIVEATAGPMTDGMVVAHEMGHSLGMGHDGTKPYTSCPTRTHVMSGNGGYGRNGDWSTCSRSALDVFMKSKKATCFFNDPRKSGWHVIEVGNTLPGQLFTATEQCALTKKDSDWIVYEGDMTDTKGPGFVNNMCRELFCTRKTNELKRSGIALALDGTPCDAKDKTKGCYDKKCVKLSSIPKDRFMGTH